MSSSLIRRLAATAAALTTAFTVASFSVEARPLDAIQKSGEVVIGVFSDKAPFGYVDAKGNYQGYDVYFGNRLAKDLGVKVKYVNSPESEIYHKSNELYGIYFAKQAIVKQDRCFLVEGYTDVISMHQSGIENVVASSGTALTPGQIRMIHRFTNNMTVLYDGDAAGIKASIRGIDMLLEEGMNVKVCLLPDGDDPDSFARKHNATEFQAFIQENETDFIRFKTNLLLEDAGKDPIKRAELIGNLVQSISIIPEAIVRDVYIKECAQLLHVEDKLLVSEVAKRREKQAEQQAERAERASVGQCRKSQCRSRCQWQSYCSYSYQPRRTTSWLSVRITACRSPFRNTSTFSTRGRICILHPTGGQGGPGVL